MSKSFAGIPIRVVRKGTILYHGTSRRYGFRDLDGPAWVTDSIETARYFARWKLDPGEIPRVMVFCVVKSIPLPTMDARGAFGPAWPPRDFDHFARAVAARLGDTNPHYMSHGYPDPQELAEAVCRVGLNGWNLIGNYQEGGADIVLCEPSRWLRRIPARRDRIAGV